MTAKKFNPLPGFRLTLGFTVFYLCLIVLIPLGGLFLRVLHLSWWDFWHLATTGRALAAYRLTFGASFIAALVNAFFGTLIAWVLVRYQFPGKRFFDALVDFPFALPTAVAGLTLANLFAVNGWLGRFLARPDADGRIEPVTLHLPWFGVVLALTFIGLPFVVRTVQPVLESFEREVEEVAATLGSSRFRTFCKIIAPTLLPAIITGFTLAFARAIGEYGSVIFISGNMPMRTEIAPLLIMTKLEQYDYAGATAIATVLLVVSFVLLFAINLLQRWSQRFAS